jgi:hypothetical protein
MDLIFPFGFPGPTAWYLGWFVVTASIYAVFLHYVLAGSIVLLARSLAMLRTGNHTNGAGGRQAGSNLLAEVLRDWLPAVLGLAITTGIAPLLFLQILYQQAFYTANLLLFHRFMLLLPALIVAYYMLYLLKSKRALRWGVAAAALVSAVAVFCFGYTAWAWAENHVLSLHQSAWVEHYRAGLWFHRSWELGPRLALWAASAFPTLAALLAWQWKWGAVSESAVDPVAAVSIARRLRALALDGLAATAVAGLAWLVLLNGPARSAIFSALGMPYLSLVMIGMGIQAFAWWPVQTQADLSTHRLLAISAGLALAIPASIVVREARRLGAIDITALADAHRQAAEVGGLFVFLTFFVVNAMVIAGCIVLVARGRIDRPDRPTPAAAAAAAGLASPTQPS